MMEQYKAAWAAFELARSTPAIDVAEKRRQVKNAALAVREYKRQEVVVLKSRVGLSPELKEWKHQVCKL